MADGRITIDTSMDTSGADRGVKNLRSNLDGLSTRMRDVGSSLTKYVTTSITSAGLAVGGAMISFGNFADELLDLNAITGMSTDEMQRWRQLATDAGVDINVVTDSMQNLNRQMERGNDLTPRLAKAFETMNMDVEDFKALEPDQQMREIVETMLDLEGADRRAFANQLNMPDLLPIISEIEDGGKSLDEVMDEIDVPFSEEDLETMNEFRQAWDNLKLELFNLMGEALMPLFDLFSENSHVIQDMLMPAIEGLVDRVVQLIEWFSDLNPETQKMIGIAIALAAVLGPVIVIAGTLVGAISAIISPVGLVVAAIVGLIAIGVALWQNWDTVKERAGELRDRVTEFLGNMRDRAVQSIQNLRDRTTQSINNMRDRAVQGVQNLRDRALSTVSNMRDRVTGFVGDMRDRAVERVRGLYEGAIEGFRDLLSGARETASDLVSQFADIDLIQIGRDIISGLWQGIRGMAGTLKRNIESFISDNVPGPIKKVLGIASPSKLMMEYGEDTGEGFELGLDRKIRDVARRAEEMAQAVVPSRKSVPPITNDTAMTAQNINGVSKQPAIIYLRLGRREFEAFVEDITEVQERERHTLEKFRG